MFVSDCALKWMGSTAITDRIHHQVHSFMLPSYSLSRIMLCKQLPVMGINTTSLLLNSTAISEAIIEVVTAWR